MTAPAGAPSVPGFRIVRELGGGGMSRVFLADDESLGRPVVIKVLGEAMAHALNAERFRREILLAARLQHPTIVPVLSAGESDGKPWFVMPYVEGASLRSRLRESGPLAIGEVVRILRNVAAALGYAHQRGIVHRDIKPDNVLVSDGTAVVLDFGVAKALAASTLAVETGGTAAGIAVGTPAYMAPEQAAGDPDVDARADIYAFGILAYELFTATTPFGGDPARMLRAHLVEAPPPLASRRADVPPQLAALVMRCLEKEREKRPQSAAEILDLLDALATPSGMRAAARRGSPSGIASAAAVPSAIYVLACAGMFFGLRWLASQGEISMRVVVISIVAALMGLPVVVAAGMLVHLRRLELGRT